MKKQILQHINGFTYRSVRGGKVDVKSDITEFVRETNLKRLQKGKSTFLTNSLKIK